MNDLKKSFEAWVDRTGKMDGFYTGAMATWELLKPVLEEMEILSHRHWDAGYNLSMIARQALDDLRRRLEGAQ